MKKSENKSGLHQCYTFVTALTHTTKSINDVWQYSLKLHKQQLQTIFKHAFYVELRYTNIFVTG